MPKSHQAYPRELKARLVEMVRAGRTPEELAERFEQRESPTVHGTGVTPFLPSLTPGGGSST
jgi:hypothetical protein